MANEISLIAHWFLLILSFVRGDFFNMLIFNYNNDGSICCDIKVAMLAL